MGLDCPDEVAPIRDHIRGISTAFVNKGGAIPSTDTATDSHGVSDPSGHTRGHFQRAHWGRSRHGFLR